MAAASMTYGSLLTDVLSYCERPGDAELTAQFPRLLMIAENKMAAKLKTLGVQQVARGTLSQRETALKKPAYWRNTMSLSLKDANGFNIQLFLRSYEFCRQFWPAEAAVGVPRYYADYNFDNFLIVPTPMTNYQMELIYFPRLTPLSAEQQVNWFTSCAPQVLLTAVVAEAQLFLKNKENAAAWFAMNSESIQDLTKEDDVRLADRTEVVR